MKESRTSNVIKNSFASLILKSVNIFIQFVMRTAFIYLLGNEYTGVSGLFTDILSVLSLMEMGLDTSMVYALYKPLADNDKKRIVGLMNFYRTAFQIIGIVVFLSGILCISFLDYIITDVPNIKENIYLIFVFYVLTSSSSYFFVYKTILLKADQKSRLISKWSVTIQIIECIFEVIALILYKQFLIYLVMHFCAVIIKNLILSHKAGRMYAVFFYDKDSRLEEKERRILIRDIMCLTAYNFSGVIINSTDSIFISAFIGTTEVAIIGNYTLIINSIRTCVEQVVNAAKPSVGNLAVTSSYKKQKEVFNRMNFIAFYVACFCCACFYTLLIPFIRDIWFNSSYEISIVVVFILTINFYIAVMVLPVESFRTANGLFVQGWIRPVVMAVMNLILDIIMGRKWGIIGIFTATTISRISTQVWYDSYLVYKEVFGTRPWKYYIDYVLKFIIMVFVCICTNVVTGYILVEINFVDFVIKSIVTFLVSNMFLIVVFCKDKNFKYFLTIVKEKLLARK